MARKKSVVIYNECLGQKWTEEAKPLCGAREFGPNIVPRKAMLEIKHFLRHRVQPILQLKNDYKIFIVNLVKNVI